MLLHFQHFFFINESQRPAHIRTINLLIPSKSPQQWKMLHARKILWPSHKRSHIELISAFAPNTMQRIHSWCENVFGSSRSFCLHLVRKAVHYKPPPSKDRLTPCQTWHDALPSRLDWYVAINYHACYEIGVAVATPPKSLGTVLLASMNALDTLGYGRSNRTCLLLPIFTITIIVFAYGTWHAHF